MPQTIHHRLHVLEAADWKDGVITLLEPQSPYRPWRYAFGESRPGDCVLLVLGTDPMSVLTVLGRIDHEGGFGGALVGGTSRYLARLVDLTTLAMMLDLSDPFETWRFDDDDAEQLILALHESRVRGGIHYRWGHSSVVAARNLLSFNGKCDGCGQEIDLTDVDARDEIHVHTVDPLQRPAAPSPIRTSNGPSGQTYRGWLRHSADDWPAVLYRRCWDRMRNGNYRSFIDFRFAQNPGCPRCGGQRTQVIRYGMVMSPDEWAPWLDMGGCCVKDEKWHCEPCGHEWY